MFLLHHKTCMEIFILNNVKAVLCRRYPEKALLKFFLYKNKNKNCFFRSDLYLLFSRFRGKLILSSYYMRRCAQYKSSRVIYIFQHTVTLGNNILKCYFLHVYKVELFLCLWNAHWMYNECTMKCTLHCRDLTLYQFCLVIYILS